MSCYWDHFTSYPIALASHSKPTIFRTKKKHNYISGHHSLAIFSIVNFDNKVPIIKIENPDGSLGPAKSKDSKQESPVETYCQPPNSSPSIPITCNRVMQELKEKLHIEQRVRAGAMSLQNSLRPNAREALLAARSIEEADMRIAYLEQELQRRTTKPDELVAVNVESPLSSIDESSLDCWKFSKRLSWKRINFKIDQLSYKLQLEQEILTAMEKMHKMQGEQSCSSAEVAERMAECKAKIGLLKRALKRYTSLHFNQDEDSPNSGDRSENAESPRRLSSAEISERSLLLDGTIRVNITNIEGVGDESTPLVVKMRTDTKYEYVQAKYKRDGIGLVKLSEEGRPIFASKCKLEIDAKRAGEVEIMIYDKLEKELLGIIFFRISWLLDKKNNADPSYLEPEVEGNNSDGNLNSGTINIGTINIGAIDNEESILDLGIEPFGNINFSILITSSKRTRVKNASIASSQESSSPTIIRKQPVVKRKQHFVLGHRFEHVKFYQLIRCAFCHDFLYRASGYQCNQCRLVCHKKCHEKIHILCIARTVNEDGFGGFEEEGIKFNIPHRFVENALYAPNWCLHCGQLVPFGRKSLALWCEECGQVCHPDCRPFIPDYCGLSVKLLESLRRTNRTFKSNSADPIGKFTLNLHDSKALGSTKLLTGSRLDSKSVSLNQFKMLKVLGKGNFGKVILASNMSDGQGNPCAIKILKKESILANDEFESVQTERRIFMLPMHPFLVQLYSCFQDESRIYFVMEYVAGGDLMYHIQRRKFTETEARFYAAQVLVALAHLHQHSVIYRDLKLDNILVSSDGYIKLADYGLCKDGIDINGGMTRTFCGTPEFMAPEILMEKPYSKSVDWWGFGILLYELLLGQAPFSGRSESEIFRAILSTHPPYPSKLSPEARDLLQKLLVKAPGLRLGSGSGDAAAVKRHPFFRKINFDHLMAKKIEPPFLPTLDSKFDWRNFDSEFTQESVLLSPSPSLFLSPTSEQEFFEFSNA